MGRLLLSAVLLFGVAGAAPATGSAPPGSAAAYLDGVITLIQRNVLDSAKVDWPAVRARARQLAAGARKTAETYPAIRSVIDTIGNRHTFFIPPGTGRPPVPSTIDVPTAAMVDDRIAILTIPAFQQDRDGERRYLTEGFAAVRAMETHAPCGWIVDLRDNGGGNMWPMITVLAPLLGEGILGSFVAADNARTEWALQDGSATLGKTPMAARANRLRLTHPEPPVAVLTSELTASSGEATLIAFRGLSRTRTFGQATAGFATANTIFPIDDGAALVLTTARDADRTGRVYDNTPIEPDQPLPTGDAVTAAQAWLHTRPGC